MEEVRGKGRPRGMVTGSRDASRVALRAEGLTVSEIAAREGVTITAICRWVRRSEGRLGARWGGGPPVIDTEHQRRMDLYDAGLSIREIAERVGKTPQAIRGWHERNGLKPHRSKTLPSTRRPPPGPDRRAMHDAGATDAQIARACGISRQAVGQWRRTFGLEPNPKCSE